MFGFGKKKTVQQSQKNTLAARKLAAGVFFGALEHHVLQDMRYACNTAMLIAATNFVPDLGHHYRGTMILLDDQFQTVF